MSENSFGDLVLDWLFPTDLDPEYFQDASVFTTSHLLSTTQFLVWRWVTFMALLLVSAAHFSVSMVTNIAKGVSFLTYWTMFMGLIYFAMVLWMTIYNTPHPATFTSFHRFLQLTYQTMWCFTFCVVVLFWAAVFPFMNINGWMSLIYTILPHGFSFLFVLLDLCFNRLRLFPRHFIWSLIFGILYLICNFAYVRSTGKSLYPTLDWHNVPMTLGSIVASFAMVALAIPLGQQLIAWRDSIVITHAVVGQDYLQLSA